MRFVACETCPTPQSENFQELRVGRNAVQPVFCESRQPQMDDQFLLPCLGWKEHTIEMVDQEVQMPTEPKEIKDVKPTDLAVKITDLDDVMLKKDQAQNALSDDEHAPQTSTLPVKVEYTTKRMRNLSKDQPKSFALRIVKSPIFEALSGFAIMLNTIQLSLELQFKGMETGYMVGADGFSKPAHAEWPGAQYVLQASEKIFLVIFSLELFLRMVALRKDSLLAPWMWIDSFLLVLSCVARLGWTLVDPSMFRLIRILRMLRVLRIVRMVSAFDPLFMIIRSMQHCMGSLVWSFVVILVIQIAVGTMLSQCLALYIMDESQDLQDRLKVFNYFGTFSRSMLTMFEISLANWIPCCRLLTRAVSEWFSLFFIIYRCMWCFGTVNVLTAIFIASTNKAVAGDDECVLRRQEKEQGVLEGKLKDLFEEFDLDGGGTVAKAEIAQLKHDPLIKQWANSLEIQVGEIEEMFDLLDATGNGEVPLKEFMDRVQKLRVGASKLDSLRVQATMKLVLQKVEELKGTTIRMI